MKEITKSKHILQPYHLILFSCLLGLIFVLNSNHINEKRAELKFNEEKNSLFNQIIQKRYLQETENEGLSDKNQNSEKVCQKGSVQLRNYYKSGNLEEIELKESEIKCEEKEKDYMKALLFFARKYLDKDKDKKITEGEENEEDDEETIKENIIKYGMRILPEIIFLVIFVFSIFGWLICCCCNCCNCCCCCCCKKPGCKMPCFIFTYIFYVVAIGVCVYGFFQTNKIFIGFDNTECSILKLLEQVLDGEVKTETPRWIGIEGINNLLQNLTVQINNLKDNTLTDLNGKKSEIEANKDVFNNKMTEFDNYCYNGGKYLELYTTEFNDINLEDYKGKKYVLDLIKLIGHKENNNYPEKSILNMLNTEYSEIVKRTDDYVKTSEDSFKDILEQNSNEVIKSLDNAQENLDKLRKPFNKINNKIGDKISEYSDYIDDYGKLGVKLVFFVLALINLALAVLMLLICLCSYKSCTECCCCRCLCKCGTHILWNILAIMMILTFLIGAILCLVGKIGQDGMSLASYIWSQENFNDENPLLLGQLNDAKKYLNICLHGNGSLESEFDLGDSLNSIEQIDEVLKGIDNATQTFNNIKNELPTFKSLYKLIDNITNLLTDDFGLVETQKADGITLKVALLAMNKEIKDKLKKGETWSIKGDQSKICVEGEDSFEEGEYELHPLYCKPKDRDWIKNSDNQNIKDYATIISSIVDLSQNLASEKEGSLNYKLNPLKESYNTYLDSYVGMLDFLNLKIGTLIGQLRESVGDGKIFEFLNGKFIGTNIQIVLKYLKYSLGKDFHKVGICLIIVGFSLMLSISSTILLIVILNVVIKKNEDDLNKTTCKEKGYSISEKRKFNEKI